MSDSASVAPPRRIALLLGFGAFVALLLAPVPEGLDPVGMRVLAVTALVAIFWVTEALPIPVTSMIPILLFPLLGIMSSDETARQYANNLIFLFFGGFFLALTLERWNAHRRIALMIVSLFGTRPRAVILGIMVAVAVLSMWISNTATTLMMLPICIALADELGRQGGAPRDVARFGVAMLLGLAYAANVGGMGTPIGTAPNGIFLRQFAGAAQPTFAQWMVFGLPLVALFLVVIWFLLTRVLFRLPDSLDFGGRDLVRSKLRDMGPVSPQERATLAVFFVTVALWITRPDLGSIPGWSSLLERLGMTWRGQGLGGVGDSAVSILAVLALCALRVGPERKPLADWSLGERVPWGMLLLLGGGFAIARGFQVDAPGGGLGLSGYLGGRLGGLADQSPLVVMPTLALGVSVLTEFTSNTATASVIVPILANVGDAETSRLLALVATLSASCAFMFPVATPPNAIVFASGRVRIREMMRAGIALNLIGALIVPLVVWGLARLALP